MDIVQVGGVLVLAWIAWGFAPRIRDAIRANRFGIRHITADRLIEGIVGLVMFAVFFYGVFKYPDGPIKPCAGSTGFCGKTGQPHTLLEYRHFNIWQNTLFAAWPIGLFIGWLLNRKRTQT